MVPPVKIKGFPNGTRVRRFDMVEFEVEFAKDFFHLSEIGERNYHNAYDADENFTLFRADAIFQRVGVQKTPYVVPVFTARGIKLSFQKPFVAAAHPSARLASEQGRR
jgi:hypothetical protein